MSKPGFAVFRDETGAAAAMLAVTDGVGPARAQLVLSDASGISELPLSAYDLRWLINELTERLPPAGTEQ